MNSRERVSLALNHRAVDRIPFDMSFTLDAYNNLVRRMGLALPPKTLCNLFSQVVPDLEAVLALGLDVAWVMLAPTDRHPRFIHGVDSYEDVWGMRYKKEAHDNGSTSYQNVNAPMADFGPDDLDTYKWPDPDDPSLFANLERQTREILDRSDLAILASLGGSVFTQASLLRGMEQWYVDLLAEPEFASELLRRLADYQTRVHLNAIQACGNRLSIIRVCNDDYGTQHNLLISPETFRQVVRPQVEPYYRAVKKAFLAANPEGKLMKHSCGAVSEMVEEFIGMGLDIVDPVQTACAGMGLAELKARFGKRVSWHGGMDTQHLLPYASPAEVAAEVRRLNALFKEDGGYILCPVHHVEPDVPPDNLLAMAEAVGAL